MLSTNKLDLTGSQESEPGGIDTGGAAGGGEVPPVTKNKNSSSGSSGSTHGTPVNKSGLVRRDTQRFHNKNNSKNNNIKRWSKGSSSGGSDHNMERAARASSGSGPNSVSDNKRPSITAEELTPIVLNQLQTASKLKEERRNLRRGSRSSNSSTPAESLRQTLNPSRQSSNGGGTQSITNVIDSGSESCGEEARIKTAEAFMSGIQSAIHSSAGNSVDGHGSSQGAVGLSAELVGEVDSVLSRLMQSVQRNDPNLIPLIVNLQASLKATAKPIDSNRQAEAQQEQREKQERETQERRQQQTDVPLSEFSTCNDETYFPMGSDVQATSKIPWKIRAARKRALKHPTTGMTKDEFAKIKQSLMASSASCKSYIILPLYSQFQ